MPGMPQAGDRYGRYTLTRALGAGGMGLVYAATDERLQREVAVKLIPPTMADDEDSRARFHREAAVLAKMDTPHVVQVFDYGDQDGTLYLVTQLLSGGDLFARTRKEGTPSPSDALEIVADVLDGLRNAHEAGVTHRDVKPSNVLIRHRGDRIEPVLCDFGIASMPGVEVTRTGSVTGSLPYMAPERYAGEPSGVAGDIYSVGCVLWFLLTGGAPYAGTEMEIAMAHLEAPTPRLPGRDPFSKRINAILERAMAKDPSERYPSARAMELEVRRAREEAPAAVELPEHTSVRRPVMPSKEVARMAARRARRPWMVGLAGALAVVVALALMLMTRGERTLADLAVAAGDSSETPSASAGVTPSADSTLDQASTRKDRGAGPGRGTSKGRGPGAGPGTGPGAQTGPGAAPPADGTSSAPSAQPQAPSGGDRSQDSSPTPAPAPTKTSSAPPPPPPPPAWRCWNGTTANRYSDCSMPTGYAGLRWVYPRESALNCSPTASSNSTVLYAIRCTGSGWELILRQFSSASSAFSFLRQYHGIAANHTWQYGPRWTSQDGGDVIISDAYRDAGFAVTSRGSSSTSARAGQAAIREMRAPDRLRGVPN